LVSYDATTLVKKIICGLKIDGGAADAEMVGGLGDTTEGYRRLRSGDYRVLYKVEGRKITVGKIGNRSHVYRWI
jgi:mRNA-degrading endonuclease RelE of RelBE toxin-antitoxin system